MTEDKTNDKATDAQSLVPATQKQVKLTISRVIQDKLGRNTPTEYVRKRKGGGGKTFSYVPWGYVARVLNEVFGPTWSLTYDPEKDVKHMALPPLPAREPSGTTPGRPQTPREEVMVTVTLTTPFGTQTATASHTYFPDNDAILYGDVIQSAVSKALRRAAARLGVGLDLYLQDDADDFTDGIVALESPDPFKDACRGHGLTAKQGIALVSKALADDSTALTTLADCIEVAGSVEAAVAALDEAVNRISNPSVVKAPDQIVDPSGKVTDIRGPRGSSPDRKNRGK